METPPPLSSQRHNAPPASAPTSGFALASMILGIVSLVGGFFLFVPPILAVVFGHVSLSQTKKNPALRGRGMGIAGLVMGYATVMIFFVGLFAAMSIPAFHKVRIASQEKAMLNNARLLSAAADQYFLEHGKTVASFDDLVGPGKSVRGVMTIDQERYPLLYKQGQEIVVVKKDGKTVKYSP
ncbi:MAG: DUF4190 domain-containing protein [Opitutaceae bacterium]